MQKKEDATELQDKSVALKKQTEEAEVTKNELESKRDKTMVVIGNLVHDSVPVDNNEVCLGHRSSGPHDEHRAAIVALSAHRNA
jgi:seryl-tRNA synthetase